MRRFASLIVAAGAVAVTAVVLAGGVASASGASAASALPTLNLAVTGTKAISVSGSEVSGAVNVVSTFTGNGQGAAALIRVNPNVPVAQALAQGQQAIQSAHGDLNVLTALGDALVFDAGVPGSAQTVLTPGAWLALNVSGNGPNPPMALFTVSKSASPAALPTPGATVKAIDFGFQGPSTLHRGELVRFENDGFLVHMIVGVHVKNTALAAAVTTALKAGKDKLARRLSVGAANFAGPLSPGGMQQEVINDTPGVYVLACFMNAQDGREHTQLGMLRTIKIAK
jgi:hypothetical protein